MSERFKVHDGLIEACHHCICEKPEYRTEVDVMAASFKLRITGVTCEKHQKKEEVKLTQEDEQDTGDKC